MKKDWAAAETLLVPLGQAQPRNPFIYYELAQVYENTNRVDAAKQIYQAILALPDANQRQYAVVVRSPQASYMASLVSLSQARLNALNAQAPSPPVAVAPVVTAPPVTVPLVKNVSEPDTDSLINSQIFAALQNWVKAWVNKDLNSYFSHYLPEHRGNASSIAAWQAQRKQLILSKKTIRIDVSDLEIRRITTNKVSASFKQNYISDSYVNTTRKNMTFVRVGDKWLIENELADR